MTDRPESTPNPAKRPTLKDIARATGYHVTTISNALREHPSIPQATRRRIQEVAREMGYERNPIYYALSRFRREGHVRAPAPRIAYLENFKPWGESQRLPYQEATLAGARRQAEVLGYELQWFAVGEDDHDTHSLTRYLSEQQITGIIVSCFKPGFAEIALNWDDFAVTKIHSRHTEPDTTVVGNDQLREVRTSFRRLLELGYKRIGLAVGRADEDACGHRHTTGYLMEEAGLPEGQRVPPLLLPYNLDEATAAAMIGRWVRRHHIDAVLCNWGNIDAMLAREGLDVPDQIACACLCLYPPAPTGLAGMVPRFDLVGERAVSIVVAQLKTAERGLPEYPLSIYVQSTWQDGPSAPARRS